MFVCTCWSNLPFEDNCIFFWKLKGPWKHEVWIEEEDTFDLGAVKQRKIKKSDFSREHT